MPASSASSDQGQEVMPFLSELRHESIYYPFTLSYHSGGGTSDCDFTVLNSVEPSRRASVFFDEHYDYPNALTKVLRGSGYGVYAFHGNVIKSWARHLAYPRMGYSEFFDIAKMGLSEQGWGAPDGAVFDFATQFTATCKAPFFAHIITMSSHYPYKNAEYVSSQCDGGLFRKPARGPLPQLHELRGWVFAEAGDRATPARGRLHHPSR